MARGQDSAARAWNVLGTLRESRRRAWPCTRLQPAAAGPQHRWDFGL